VVDYDKHADLELLKAITKELKSQTIDEVLSSPLADAENNLRVEALSADDPLSKKRIADAISSL